MMYWDQERKIWAFGESDAIIVHKTWCRNNPKKKTQHSDATIEKLRVACIGNNKVKFGVYIAETLFYQIYPTAAPTGFKFPGYDFMLDDVKIDVKASIFGKTNRWVYQIDKNKIAQTFALMAFDNHESHNLLHMWFVPADVINTKVSISIAPGTLHHWSEYEIDLTDVDCILTPPNHQCDLSHWI